MDPPGTHQRSVVIVFTDIEGSTVLWERVPDAVRAALLLHDAVLREALATHGGYEFRTEGDAFKVSFASCAAAVRWCLDIQQRLLEVPWPEDLLAHRLAATIHDTEGRLVHRGLRVRIGGHVGEPELVLHPTTGRADYYGPMVNKAARVASAPHGGQIVCSAALWARARAEDPHLEAAVVDLGEHRLKGIQDPEPLVQVLPVALAHRRFPPVNTQTATRTNLRARTDGFLGRTGALAAIDAALAAGASLVTLLGPGGTGKTRLATEYGASRLSGWSADGGIWLCPLEAVSAPLGLARAVAEDIRIPLSMSDSQAAEAATRAVGERLARLGRLLLILDNLEQLDPPAVGAIGAWLHAAPRLCVLATSRHRLGLPGEHVLSLDPLSAEEAISLFSQRASEARPGFRLGPRDRALALEIVEQLDRMPLAIELAAARLPVMSVRAIHRRLGERFRLLARSGAGPARQAGLRGALDWSWELLTGPEQTALAQCSVFCGGFAAESAEDVVDLEGFEDAPWTVDLVQSLCDKSLLRSTQTGGAPRLDMYKTIQAYAHGKLTEAGAVEATASRHAAHFLERAEETAEATRGPEDDIALAALQADDAAEEAGDDALLVKCLDARGHALQVVARADLAHADFTRGIALAKARGDQAAHARSLRHLATTTLFGRLPLAEAQAMFAEAIALYRALGDARAEGITRSWAAMSRLFEPDPDLEAIEADGREAARMVEAHGGPLALALARGRLLMATGMRGDWREVEVAYLEDIGTFKAIGDPIFTAFAHAYIAVASAHLGRMAHAEAHLHDTRALCTRLAQPGLRAMGDITAAWLDAIRAIHAPDEPTRTKLLTHTRALLQRLRAPGGDGARPLAERSAAVSFMTGLVDRDVAIAIAAPLQPA